MWFLLGVDVSAFFDEFLSKAHHAPRVHSCLSGHHVVLAKQVEPERGALLRVHLIHITAMLRQKSNDVMLA